MRVNPDPPAPANSVEGDDTARFPCEGVSGAGTTSGNTPENHQAGLALPLNLLSTFLQDANEPGSSDPGNGDPRPSDQTTLADPEGEETYSTAGRSGDPWIGEIPRLFGEYVLLEMIARGGMGIVHRARQVKLQRLVALKMILSDRLGSAEDVRRFYVEAEAAAGLDHPGIVPIYEVGEHAGQHFFSMLLVNGGNLAGRIKEGPLPPRASAALIAQVADAVAYAHGQGIIHRDLKPSNILIDRDENPRVTDFGLAKNIRGDSDLTASGQIMGTPSFMPPEQARGQAEAVGPSSDVYSLGATLYCILTGRPPFQAATPVETLKQVLELEPVSPKRLNAAVDRDLETICLKCLQKDPGRRYPTASDLADDLRRFLAGEPISARPVGRAERAWRLCRRNPVIAGLTIGIAFSLLLGTIVSTTQWARAQRETDAARAAQHLSERRWYIAEMNLAHQDWKDGYTALAEARLRRQAGRAVTGSDPRGFEWYFLRRLCRMELASLPDHTAPVKCLAFTPDGAGFVTAADGRSGGPVEIRTWRTSDRSTVRTVHPSWAQVFGIGFRGNGSVLAAVGAAAGQPGEVRLWDAADGHEIGTIPGRSDLGIRAFAFSPSGDRLALAEADPVVRVVDLNGLTLQELRGSDGPLDRVAFAPDGRSVAAVGWKGILLVWEWPSGRIIRRLEGLSGAGNSLAYAPDGKSIAAAGEASVVQIWSIETGRVIRSLLGHSEWIRSIGFSPDGLQIASAGDDRTVRLWDLESGKPAGTLRGHSEPVTAVAFSPDGWRLISAGGDATVKLWEPVQTQEYRSLHGHRSSVNAVAFSPDGRRLASAGVDCTVRIFDAARESEVLVLQGHAGSVLDVEFDPGGELLASAGEDGTVRIWDASTGTERAVLRGHMAVVNRVAFSPDGRWIASASAGYDRGDRPCRGELILWDIASGKQRASFGPAPHERSWKGFLAVDFSPDGRSIATACGDRSVRVWDIGGRTPPRILVNEKVRARALAYSPDGRRLAISGDDRMIHLVDLMSGRSLTLRGHTAAVRGVAFSPDCQRLASVSGGHNSAARYLTGEVKLWDVVTGQEILTVRHRSAFANDIAYSPDGLRLATADADRRITLWDAAEPLATMSPDRQARSLVGHHFNRTPTPPLAEVERIIRADPSIDEPLRVSALARASEMARDRVLKEAEDLVHSLLLKPMFRDEVVRSLMEDATIGPDLRREAILIAKSAVEKPRSLNNASRGVVRRPDAPAVDYILALRRAEAACSTRAHRSVLPDNAGYGPLPGRARLGGR